MLRKQTGHILGLEREKRWQWASFSTRSRLRALDLVGNEVLPADHGFGNRSWHEMLSTALIVTRAAKAEVHESKVDWL